MDGEEERNPEDREFARRIGERFTRRLLDSPITPYDWLRPESAYSTVLLTEIGGELFDTYHLGPVHGLFEILLDEASTSLKNGFESGLRQISLARAAGLEGLVVVRGESNDFEEPLLADLLNPRALRALFNSHGELPPRNLQLRMEEWPERIRTFVERSPETVIVVPEYEGAKGFLTAFADSLRSAWKWFNVSGNTHVHFTVTQSNTKGYALECYPQYQYSPQAFGSKPTWPVDATLQINHYKFQGYLNSQLAKDPRTHFAGPSSTSTFLTI